MSVPEIELLVREIDEFKHSFSVVTIATSDAEGKPEASHAPFAMDERGDFVVLISELAKHTQNLSVNPIASLLLLEPENNAANMFALRRLQFTCQVEFITTTEARGLALEILVNRFGKFIDTLSSMGDFKVVRLKPVQGKFVRGFAQTFQLSGQGLQDVELYKPDVS